VARDQWLELVQRFPLRPICTPEALDRAISFIDGLIDQVTRTPDEEDYLEVLGDLVSKYEAMLYPDEPVSGAAVLGSLLEAKDITYQELASTLDIEVSRLSSVLSGKQSLTLAEIDKLARFFRVKRSVFLPN
jgi:HTH-type transcriptional regulator/antitoxin HigA